MSICEFNGLKTKLSFIFQTVLSEHETSFGFLKKLAKWLGPTQVQFRFFWTTLCGFNSNSYISKYNKVIHNQCGTPDLVYPNIGFLAGKAPKVTPRVSKHQLVTTSHPSFFKRKMGVD